MITKDDIDWSIINEDFCDRDRWEYEIKRWDAMEEEEDQAPTIGWGCWEKP